MTKFRFSWGAFTGTEALHHWSPAVKDIIFTGGTGAAGRWQRVVTGWPVIDGTGPLTAKGSALDALDIDVRFEQIPDASTHDVARTTINAFSRTMADRRRFPCAATIQIRPARFDEMMNCDPKVLIDAISHELGHALGLGTLFEERELIRDGTPPTYIGVDAVRAYSAIRGNQGGTAVPVEFEKVGTAGRKAYHWSQQVLPHELMSSDIESAIGDSVLTNQLTTVSVGALADLGYVVDPSTAQPYPR